MSGKLKKHTLTVNLTEKALETARENLMSSGLTISEYVELCFCLPFIKPTLFKQVVELLSDEISTDGIGSYKAVKDEQGTIKTSARKLYKLFSKNFPLRTKQDKVDSGTEE